MKDFLDKFIRESKAAAIAARFFYQFMAACYWIWSTIIRRIIVPFDFIIRPLYRWWRAGWDKVVYDKHKSFRYSRAGMYLTATLVFIYFIPTFALLIMQTSFYLMTGGIDEVYLTQSQEIYPDDDIHSVKGCVSLPCSDQTSIYYRVGPSTFNQVWSIVHQHDIFIPDNVAAAVPPGLNACKVRAYGFRAKFLIRKMDIYPDALEIECEPVAKVSPMQSLMGR